MNISAIQLGTNLTSITLYLMVIAIALFIIAAKLPNQKNQKASKKKTT